MTLVCPVDRTELSIADRAGIEIDWCPTCRGVWLDRGELDKIIERSARTGADDRGAPRRYRDDDRDDDDRDDDRDDDDRRPRGRRRRGGFLDDLFDFG